MDELDTALDLDVTFTEVGTVVGALMNKTSDNCGSTLQSACVGCITD